MTIADSLVIGVVKGKLSASDFVGMINGSVIIKADKTAINFFIINSPFKR
jgi:hypothetical protein